MRYISVSGPIAAGKSTLLHRITERLGSCAESHVELPQNNPFMNEYYSDSARWSFHSQMTFLALYFDDPAPSPDCRYYFYDRCMIENLVIARYRLEAGHLTRTEYDIIEKMARGIERLMPPIDRYIYLRCSVPRLIEHTRSRARSYETVIDYDFTIAQKRLYDEWAETLPKDRTLIVDQDADVDLDRVLAFITAE